MFLILTNFWKMKKWVTASIQSRKPSPNATSTVPTRRESTMQKACATTAIICMAVRREQKTVCTSTDRPTLAVCAINVTKTFYTTNRSRWKRTKEGPKIHTGISLQNLSSWTAFLFKYLKYRCKTTRMILISKKCSSRISQRNQTLLIYRILNKKRKKFKKLEIKNFKASTITLTFFNWINYY